MITNYENLKQEITDIDKLLPYSQVLNSIKEMGNIIAPNTPSDDSKPWPMWLVTNSINTILNQEFVDELYREMLRRRFAGISMIEICAGNGKLSYHLRKRGIDIVATDDYSSKMERDESLVERLNHKDALEKYKPRLVLASWIPYEALEIGDDVLRFPTVDYFIDIREPQRGSSWITKDYENEDFIMKYLANVAKYAIGTTDYFQLTEKGKVEFVSHTCVFLWKRKGAPMSIDHTVK